MINNSKGFSLIELLVVMAIIGILLSVVTPNIFQFKTRFEIQREQKKLEQFIAKQSYNSYFHEQAQTISFVGNQVTGSLGDIVSFEYLTFIEDEFVINRFGAFPQMKLTYLANGTTATLEIKTP